jgi:precorrin-6B methylase 1
VDAEHLLVFPDRDAAELVAEQLESAGFTDVRVVREALAGEDDSEAHEWAVHVCTPDEPAYAVRFLAIAERHDGWYDPHPRG